MFGKRLKGFIVHIKSEIKSDEKQMNREIQTKTIKAKQTKKTFKIQRKNQTMKSVELI